MGDLIMGKLALAAKITHVPSMYLSELPGKNHGCRQGAIDGHKEISKRCRELGVDTINMHASTNERDYFSAVAWRGEEKVADVTWIPRLEEE